MNNSIVFTNEKCKTNIYYINKIKNYSNELIEPSILLYDITNKNINWEILQTCFSNKFRKYKSKLKNDFKPTNEQITELKFLYNLLSNLTEKLFPNYKNFKLISSLRPSLSGPEPIHFDKKLHNTLRINCFINISTVPRVYKIGPTLHYFIKKNYNILKKFKTKNLPGHLLNNNKLLDNEPKHFLFLAPKSVLIFDAETIAHELIIGVSSFQFLKIVTDYNNYITPIKLLEDIHK